MTANAITVPGRHAAAPKYTERYGRLLTIITPRRRIILAFGATAGSANEAVGSEWYLCGLFRKAIADRFKIRALHDTE